MALPPPLPRRPEDDPVLRMVIPVGRSGWAIAAGYAGLVSLFGCFVMGPVAIGLSLMAIRDIKRHPQTHGMGRAIFGLVGGTLGTLVLAALLVALLIDAAGKG
jgi:hypothetical protein